MSVDLKESKEELKQLCKDLQSMQSELGTVVEEFKGAKTEGDCLKADLFLDSVKAFLSSDRLDHGSLEFCRLCTKVGFGLTQEEVKERFSYLGLDKDSFNLFTFGVFPKVVSPEDKRNPADVMVVEQEVSIWGIFALVETRRGSDGSIWFSYPKVSRNFSCPSRVDSDLFRCHDFSSNCLRLFVEIKPHLIRSTSVFNQYFLLFDWSSASADPLRHHVFFNFELVSHLPLDILSSCPPYLILSMATSGEEFCVLIGGVGKDKPSSMSTIFDFGSSKRIVLDAPTIEGVVEAVGASRYPTPEVALSTINIVSMVLPDQLGKIKAAYPLPNIVVIRFASALD
ncbi:hypothetical protein ACH5RR_030184 [Cinchona calisaya]|uniref:Uncharacterized protein n=1 Tax=Cinchona calisaya TaxID=153742 RepID=A0ABD2YZ29_9GENT